MSEKQPQPIPPDTLAALQRIEGYITARGGRTSALWYDIMRVRAEDRCLAERAAAYPHEYEIFDGSGAAHP